MSTEQKRAAIKELYPNWTKLNKMPEHQVHVIYMRLVVNKK